MIREYHDQESADETFIETAIRTWRGGEPIDTDLAMKLAVLGYDVPALEDKYLII